MSKKQQNGSTATAHFEPHSEFHKEENERYAKGFQVYQLGTCRIAKAKLLGPKTAKGKATVERRELIKAGVNPDGEVQKKFDRKTEEYVYTGNFQIHLKNKKPVNVVLVPDDYEQTQEVRFVAGDGICDHCVDMVKTTKKSYLIGSEKFTGVIWWDRKLQMFYVQVWIKEECVEMLLHSQIESIMRHLQIFYESA